MACPGDRTRGGSQAFRASRSLARLPQVFEAVGTGIKRFREAQADDAEPADVTPPAPARKAISEGEAVATEAEEVRTSTASR